MSLANLVKCASVLLVFSCIDAAEIPKIEKKIDESLPTNDFEFQDVTTIIPPLIEGEPSPHTVVEVAPDANLISNSGNEAKIPDVPGNQNHYVASPYFPSQYYPNYPQYPAQYPQYPWPYTTQYLPQPHSYVRFEDQQAYVPTVQDNAQTTQTNVQTAQMPQTNVAAPIIPTPYGPVQAEFEGYLVPFMPPPPLSSEQQPQPPPSQQTQQQTNLSKDSKASPVRTNYDLAILLQALLPPNVIQTVFTWINFILNSFSVMAFAAVLTSAICSLTPICTLTFGALPISFQKQFMAKMSNNDGTQITTIQRVRRAVDMLDDAVEKYERLQENVASMQNSLKRAKSF